MFKLQDKHHTLKRIWAPLLVVFVLLGISLGGLVAYANTFENRVFPGVQIGSIPVGGMTHDELRDFLNEMNDKLLNEGFHFSVEHDKGIRDLVIYPIVVSETNSTELMTIDIDKNIEFLMAYGRRDNIFSSAVSAIMSRTQQPDFPVQYINASEQRILETLSESLADYENQPVDAALEIVTLDPLVYNISTSSPGVVYDTSMVIDELVASWESFDIPRMSLSPILSVPSVAEDDVKLVAQSLGDVVKKNDVRITHSDPKTQFERVWTIRKNILQNWIEVVREEDELALSLNEEQVIEYLDARVGPDVDVAAQNARFEIAGEGAVKAFQSSRPGVTLNREEMVNRIETALFTEDPDELPYATSTQNYILVAAQVDVEEPSVTLGEANDLGITEILGVGYSNFGGSPPNRVKNIRNAIRKLNGLLIAPGEEFSTIAQTKPYTLEGGYVPELVIKGDRIIPEMGGGLCQIGSTLFRMAMNSGMDITQRRNHSLVVSYYNDHRNGLPGTDATLYDPAPDFRFLNDTGNYVLIEAEADYTKQELFFTLWGTSDGRKASYSLPTVHRWIDYGETKYIKTTEIPAGTEECQNAYRGADVSFTYSRVTADGEKEDTVYKSYYRPLSQICLVGVTEEELACDQDESCVPGETPSLEVGETNGETVVTPTEIDTPVADPTVDPEAFTDDDQRRIEESVIFPGDVASVENG